MTTKKPHIVIRALMTRFNKSEDFIEGFIAAQLAEIAASGGKWNRTAMLKTLQEPNSPLAETIANLDVKSI